MGKSNKKGPKGNVFKVVGAKSLNKRKAKPVNIGLKNLKQKVQDIDKEFVEINNKPKASQPKNAPAVIKVPPKVKKSKKPVSKEEVTKTTEGLVKMDL